MGIPYGDSILQLEAYQNVVGSLSHPGEFCFYISFEKAQGTVGVSGNPVYSFQDRQVKISTPNYLALVTASRTCPCK